MRLADPGILVVLAAVVIRRWLVTDGADWLARDQADLSGDPGSHS